MAGGAKRVRLERTVRRGPSRTTVHLIYSSEPRVLVVTLLFSAGAIRSEPVQMKSAADASGYGVEQRVCFAGIRGNGRGLGPAKTDRAKQFRGIKRILG